MMKDAITTIELVLLETPEDRERARLKVMGLGGVGKAAKETGVKYWRLSRILNGWIAPNDAEVTSLTAYLRSNE